MLLGIDYGAKLSGKTVICYDDSSTLQIVRAEKGKDADAFIQRFVHKNEDLIELIAIDAPLSLPRVYYDQGTDYFYRQCDRQAGAMSPMFLGGLTARAMRLVSLLDRWTWIECYPSLHLRKRDLQFRKNKETLLKVRKEQLSELPLYPTESPRDWHEMDACLAWWTAYRYNHDQCEKIGDRAEGLIYL